MARGGKQSKAENQSALGACVHPDAAGIDLGASSHYVALPRDREASVRMFSVYTEDLEAMADWLCEHRIKTVAMEATGVYWVPVFQVLEKRGLKVELVNPRHYRNVPGRKTDVQDCQWLQYLHEAGLIRGSFRPADAICVVRTYTRQRDTLLEEAARHVLRIQKALEQMNVQLHKVVSNVQGKTGMAVIRAIVAGERCPEALAKLRDERCRRSVEELAKALRGDWRQEHLFCLEQELSLYDDLQRKIAACEAAMTACWNAMPAQEPRHALGKRKHTQIKSSVRKQMYRLLGHDLTAAEGLGTGVLEKLIAETGTDMTSWPTEKHFTSWAKCCPPNNITGGKRHRSIVRGRHRVRQIFKKAAMGMSNSKSALGAYYRRIRGRRGAAIANDATAHKIARTFYRLMKYGEAYVAPAAAYYEQQYRTRVQKAAVRRLEGLGFRVNLEPEEGLLAGS